MRVEANVGLVSQVKGTASLDDDRVVEELVAPVFAVDARSISALASSTWNEIPSAVGHGPGHGLSF